MARAQTCEATRPQNDCSLRMDLLRPSDTLRCESPQAHVPWARRFRELHGHSPSPKESLTLFRCPLDQAIWSDGAPTRSETIPRGLDSTLSRCLPATPGPSRTPSPDRRNGPKDPSRPKNLVRAAPTRHPTSPFFSSLTLFFLLGSFRTIFQSKRQLNNMFCCHGPSVTVHVATAKPKNPHTNVGTYTPVRW